MMSFVGGKARVVRSVEQFRSIVAFSPFMGDNAGHDLDYHLAVGSAASAIGWKYEVAIPKTTSRREIPNAWFRVLPEPIFGIPKLSLWIRLRRLLWYIQCFWRLLGVPDKHPSSRRVLFVEHFTGTHLIALTIALLARVPNIAVLCVLYRGTPSSLGRVRLLHKICIPVLRWRIPGGVRLMTDSDRLKLSWEAYFGAPVVLMPIPHTSQLISAGTVHNMRADTAVVRCWWPGAPRVSKGLDLIKWLAARLRERRHNFVLVAARSACLSEVTGTDALIELDDVLPRQEYELELQRASFTLLPYDPKIYSESTSGIFVEAVIAGGIPLVTDGTWMAGELQKHGLERLAHFWDCIDPIQELLLLKDDPDIARRLETMKKHYIEYHNVKHFANVLRSVIEPGEAPAV